RAHENVPELEGQVLLLALPGPARRERRLLDVLSRGARLHERGARPVQVHREVEVLERGLAGSAAAPGATAGGIRLTEAPGLDVDLVLVLGVGALPLDAVELDEEVDRCHRRDPSTPPPGPAAPANGRRSGML